MGSLSAGTGHRAGSAASGADSDTRAVGGGVEMFAGAAVGEGSSEVARISVDGSWSVGDNGGGVHGNGDVTGGRLATEPVEEAICGEESGGDYPPPSRTSTTRPRIVSSPPSSSS